MKTKGRGFIAAFFSTSLVSIEKSNQLETWPQWPTIRATRTNKNNSRQSVDCFKSESPIWGALYFIALKALF